MLETTMYRLMLITAREMHREGINPCDVSIIRKFMPVSISTLNKNGFTLSETDSLNRDGHYASIDFALLRMFADGIIQNEPESTVQERFRFPDICPHLLVMAEDSEPIGVHEQIALEDAAECIVMAYRAEMRIHCSKKTCRAS